MGTIVSESNNKTRSGVCSGGEIKALFGFPAQCCSSCVRSNFCIVLVVSDSFESPWPLLVPMLNGFHSWGGDQNSSAVQW